MGDIINRLCTHSCGPGAFSSSLGDEEIQKITTPQKSSDKLVETLKKAGTKIICSLEVRSWITGWITGAA